MAQDNPNYLLDLERRIVALEAVSHAPVKEVPDADDLEKQLNEMRAAIEELVRKCNSMSLRISHLALSQDGI